MNAVAKTTMTKVWIAIFTAVAILAALFIATSPSDDAEAATATPGNNEALYVNGDNTVYVSGWVYDPTTKKAARAHVYVDSSGANVSPTVTRTDVKNAFGLAESVVGYSYTTPVLSPGTHTVTVYGVSANGANSVLETKTVEISGSTASVKPVASSFGPTHSAFSGAWLTFRDGWTGDTKFFTGGTKMSGRSDTIGYCAGQYGPGTPIEDGNADRTWGMKTPVSPSTGWTGSVAWINGTSRTLTGDDIRRLAFVVNFYGDEAENATLVSKTIDNYFGILGYWKEFSSYGPPTSSVVNAWNTAENYRGPYSVTSKITKNSDGKYSFASSVKSTSSATKLAPTLTYTAKIVTTGNIKLVWDGSGTSSTTGKTSATTSGAIDNLGFHYVPGSGSGSFYVNVSFSGVPDSTLWVSKSPLKSAAKPGWYTLTKNYGQDVFVSTSYTLSAASNTLSYSAVTFGANGATEVCVGTSTYCDPEKDKDASGNAIWSTSAKARNGDTYYWRVKATNASTDPNSTISIAPTTGDAKNYANPEGVSTAADVISPGETARYRVGPYTYNGTSTMTNKAVITTYGGIFNTTNGDLVGNTSYAKSTTTTAPATLTPHTFSGGISVQVCTTGTDCVETSDTGWASSASFTRGTKYLVRYKYMNSAASTAPLLNTAVTYGSTDGSGTSHSEFVPKIGINSYEVSTFVQTANFEAPNGNVNGVTSYKVTGKMKTAANSGNLIYLGDATINRIYSYSMDVEKYVCVAGVNCYEFSPRGWVPTARYNYGNTDQMFKVVVTNKSDVPVTGIKLVDDKVSAGNITDPSRTLAVGKSATYIYKNTEKLTEPYTSTTTATFTGPNISATAAASVSVNKTYYASLSEKVCLGDEKTCDVNNDALWFDSVTGKSGDTVTWKYDINYSGNYDPVKLSLTSDQVPTCAITYESPNASGTKKTRTCTETISYDKKVNVGTLKVVDAATSETLNTVTDSATVLRQLKAGYTLSTRACVPASGRDCATTSADSNWLWNVQGFNGNTVDWRVKATNSGESTLNAFAVKSLLNDADSTAINRCQVESTSALKTGTTLTSACSTTLGENGTQTVKSTLTATVGAKTIDDVE